MARKRPRKSHLRGRPLPTGLVMAGRQAERDDYYGPTDHGRGAAGVDTCVLPGSGTQRRAHLALGDRQMQIHRRTDCQSGPQSIEAGYVSICRSGGVLRTGWRSFPPRGKPLLPTGIGDRFWSTSRHAGAIISSKDTRCLSQQAPRRRGPVRSPRKSGCNSRTIFIASTMPGASGIPRAIFPQALLMCLSAACRPRPFRCRIGLSDDLYRVASMSQIRAGRHEDARRHDPGEDGPGHRG